MDSSTLPSPPAPPARAPRARDPRSARDDESLGAASVAPIRVLHVVESFGAGTFEVVRALSGRMAEAGHHVAVAHGARRETPADAAEMLHAGVTVFSLPWTRRTPRAQVAAARALRALVRRWQPDLVHLHSSFAGVVGAAVLGGGGLPLVYTPHAYTFTMGDKPPAVRAVFKLLERFVARRVTIVGAVSASEESLAREIAHAPRTAVVENGIAELDAEPDERAADKRPLVVAAGRATPQRRPEACARILEAVSEAAETQWLGGGDPQSPAVAALREAGVSVTGWLEREEVLRRLAEATVYLHWSAWDGHPLAVLEAMANDVVVVASDIPANRDIVGARQTCSDEAEAAALIDRALRDKELRASLLADQRSRRGHYGTDRMAREWLELYVRVLDAPVVGPSGSGVRARQGLASPK